MVLLSCNSRFFTDARTRHGQAATTFARDVHRGCSRATFVAARRNTTRPRYEPLSVIAEPRLDPTGQSEAALSSQFEAYPWTTRWWPVLSAEGINPKIPKHVDLLDMSLVVWADSQGNWHCLEDKCPHRLAPLSQGRVEGDTLMCSYHGWQFSSSGSCTRIPQLDHDLKAQSSACSSRRSCARAYPTTKAHGLLWVWPETGEAAWHKSTVTPPGECLQLHKTSGSVIPWFVRDLPLRFDSLAENLLDPTHVPYSHHGLGPVSRYNPWLAKVWDTTTSEPVSITGAKMTAASDGSTLEFIAPHSVRYKYMPGGNFGPQFFMVPTKPGWTKLVWHTSFGGKSPVQKAMEVVPALKSFLVAVAHTGFQNTLLDGDTYMLHVAERGMPVSGGVGLNTVSRLHYMPAAGDAAVMGMRKWMQQFNGNIPTCNPSDEARMPHEMPVEQVLDRYSQHTKDCYHCSRTLRIIDHVQQSSLVAGALAVMTVISCGVAAAVLPYITAPGLQPPNMVPSISVSMALALAFVWLHKLLSKWRQKFYYEAYIHAEKD